MTAAARYTQPRHAVEALRYDITPVGLHSLLIHYDIPWIDPADWRLSIGGCVGTPLELSPDDL